MALKIHIDTWITKAEPDYYTMFIKAWIPFNAWYCTEYGTTKDKVALDQIKTTKNKVRNRLESLLLNSDDEGQKFRQNLAQLHHQLVKRSIHNSGKLVSFTAIVIDGIFPDPVTDTDAKQRIYKAIPSKSAGYRAVILDKSTKTILDITTNPYKMSDLLLHPQFIGLGDPVVQAKIKTCFEQIDPDRPIDLTKFNKKVKTQYIVLDALSKTSFVNDTELIAKSIVQILYSLRCLLFHGELDPTETNQSIYEYGFNILKQIIKELK